MKIKEFAEKQGRTKGAIYKAIRNSSFQLSQITNQAGNITPEGMTILNSLFPEPEKNQLRQTEPGAELRDAIRERDSLQDALDIKGRECEELREQLKEAKERAEKWERLYLEEQEQAKLERAEMRREIDNAHMLTAQAQHLSMNPLRRLFSGRKKGQTVEASGEIK